MGEKNERLAQIDTAIANMRNERIANERARPQGMSFSQFLLEGADLIDPQDMMDLGELMKAGGE